MKTRKMSTPLKDLGSKPVMGESVESVPTIVLESSEKPGSSLSSILENGAAQQAEIAILKKKLEDSENRLKAFENSKLVVLEEGEIVEDTSLVWFVFSLGSGKFSACFSCVSLFILFTKTFLSRDDQSKQGPSTLPLEKTEKIKKKPKKSKKKSKKVNDVSESSDTSDDSESDDDSQELPFLLKPDKLLNSLDKTALSSLHSEFMLIPKVLSKIPKVGGDCLKTHFRQLKTLVEQVKLIRKSVTKEPKGKELRKNLKITLSWFNDTFFEDYSVDTTTSGFLDCLRNELREAVPIQIFGSKHVRKIRTLLKSFGDQNKTLKSASPATFLLWQCRKRTYQAAGGSGYVKRDGGPDKKKDSRFNGYVKK